MTALAVALAALALIDGACSGFRSGVGRTGLVRHGEADRRAAMHGLVLVACLLLPAAALISWDLNVEHAPHRTYISAARGMLYVLAPYAGAVGAALLAYGLLGWRQRYLAMAVVLGPLTLIRVAVVVVSAGVGCAVSSGLVADGAIALSVLAILSVEPLMNLRWRKLPTA